jgi:hypothetical protein
MGAMLPKPARSQTRIKRRCAASPVTTRLLASHSHVAAGESGGAQMAVLRAALVMRFASALAALAMKAVTRRTPMRLNF